MIVDMASPVDLIAMFVQLARVSGMRGRPYVQDRLLVCAAIIAAQAELPQTAQLCRQRILRHNPQHWLGRFASVEEALADDETIGLVRQAQRRYPPERAEQLYDLLGLSIADEHARHVSERAFLAAVLGATVGEIDEHA
jgi:hypothetical protein